VPLSFVAFSGDIDVFATASMRAILLEAIRGDPHDLTVDLRKVRHLSMGGVAVLIGANRRQMARARVLILVCPPNCPADLALGRAGVRGRFATVEDVPA
jgi:anti-anti-sigma factor